MCHHILCLRTLSLPFSAAPSASCLWTLAWHCRASSLRVASHTVTSMVKPEMALSTRAGAPRWWQKCHSVAIVWFLQASSGIGQVLKASWDFPEKLFLLRPTFKKNRKLHLERENSCGSQQLLTLVAYSMFHVCVKLHFPVFFFSPTPLTTCSQSPLLFLFPHSRCTR